MAIPKRAQRKTLTISFFARRIFAGRKRNKIQNSTDVINTLTIFNPKGLINPPLIKNLTAVKLIAKKILVA